MVEHERTAAIVELARRCGLHPSSLPVRLAGSANNRAYRLDADERVVFAKAYFRDPDDARDRIGAELAFSRFAWGRGAGAVPEPLGADEELGIALFGFVDGRHLRAEEIDDGRIDEALAFVDAVNRDRCGAEARALPAASEACFAITDHLALIDARIERLAAIEARSDLDRALVRTLDERLRPCWSRVRAAVVEGVRVGAAGADEPLARTQRCVSPSDFGFHNALLDVDGRLVFHDFEYAGWDDPAKLVGDFACQPAVPVSARHAGRFADGVAQVLGLDDRERARASMLAPAFRVKWCCIILNEFLPAEQRRRRFAGDREADEARKGEQLAKAEAMLAELEAGT